MTLLYGYPLHLVCVRVEVCVSDSEDSEDSEDNSVSVCLQSIVACDHITATFCLPLLSLCDSAFLQLS